MVESVREAALKALFTLLEGVVWPVPAPVVSRNEPEPAAIPDGGLVSLLDGEPGAPEVYLGRPPQYAYSHEATLLVLVQKQGAEVRDALLDELLRAIGAAVEADPTLGGVVEFAQVSAPAPLTEPIEGARSVKGCEIAVVLDYVSPAPLG